MAMSALEVAAIFRIDEQPALRSLRLIAEQVKALGAEIKEMVGQSNTAFGSIFTKMDTGIGTSIIEVGRLKAAWREVEVAAGRQRRSAIGLRSAHKRVRSSQYPRVADETADSWRSR
jgi:predicted sugar kinase